jgi:hypothetical protein
MNYLKCLDCGITRNLDEAPDCPVCRVKQLHKKEAALFSRKTEEGVKDDLESLKIRRAFKVTQLASLEEKTERLEKVLKQQARQLIKELKDLLYP